jgi:2'-5' RNA ligase
MRLFVALELQPAIADALDLAIAPLRETEPDLAWVPRDKLHLTMKFLGDVGETAVTAISRAADGVAARHRPFDMRLGEVGAFPNFRRARVVWIGVENEPRLELLHHDLEIACAELGYEVEGRAFRPHVTLARVRTTLPLDRARRFARAARGVDFVADTHVASLIVMESVIATPQAGGGGARYRRIHAAALGELGEH